MPLNPNSIGQSGEYLVASELCRRDIVATTFSRNMPGFDILAFNNKKNKVFKIQVKTVQTGEWQLNAKHYLIFNQELFDIGIQQIVGITNNHPADYFVFVRQSTGGYGTDHFYILSTKKLQQIIKNNYSAFLQRNNGQRPRNPKTTHIALKDTDLVAYKDNWDFK